MAVITTENNDLVWDLNAFQRRKRAEEFVLHFENKLCVHSSSVNQLYTNYNIFFPQEENRKLVILPNPYAHHDTFQNISEEAIRPTGLLICPPRIDDDQGRLTMMIPMKNDRSNFKRVPINVGLHMINQKRPPDRPFLPVLIKGDLREFDLDTPCIHLHAIQLHLLKSISELERKDICNVIGNRLEKLVKA